MFSEEQIKERARLLELEAELGGSLGVAGGECNDGQDGTLSKSLNGTMNEVLSKEELEALKKQVSVILEQEYGMKRLDHE